MNCCDYDCNQGRNCPVRKAAQAEVQVMKTGLGKIGPEPTLRERFEEEHFGIKPAKVAKVRLRWPAALTFEPPLRWRRTLKGWAKFWLGVVLGLAAGPYVLGVGMVLSGVAK
jgi:hypothetical protein